MTAALATGVGMALTLHGARAAAAEPAGPDLVQWLVANTDMAAAQVVIAGPEYVYTLEPLGPRAATGEQVALVRTERLDAAPDAASWEAHLLIDCSAGRLRQIRGATFAGRNRTGAPARDKPSDAWIQPDADQPAMKLLAAACDPAFAWPLRPFLTAESAPPPPGGPALLPPPPPPPSSQPQIVIISPTEPAAVAGPPAATEPAAAPPAYGVQVARGPSEEGASRALARARRTLGEQSNGLEADIERSQVGERRRFTAVLLGFPTAEAADAACRTLQEGGQTCFVRSPPGAAEAPRAVAAAVPPDAFAVQVARGPSEEGAGRALAAARKALGRAADGLADVIEQSRVGDRRRFTAVLAGFPSAEATAEACEVLKGAGQLCLTRSPASPTTGDEQR